MRRLTIYDVARAAGVAPSTVSRAYGRPGRVHAHRAPSGLEEFLLEYDRQTTGHDDMPALAAAARVAGLDSVGAPPAHRTQPV